MTIVQNIMDYKKIISASNLIHSNFVELNQLKEIINTELTNKNSTLAFELTKLSEAHKSLLIAALVSNDSNTFCELLLPYLSKLHLELVTHYLHRITEQDDSSDNDYWLNATVRLIIDKMIQEDALDSHANARNTRILQHAMQMIPESTIHIKTKVALCRELDYSAAEAISDYSYNESLAPLLANRFSGNISVREYKTAIQSPQLDYSDYIMLTLGLLQGALSAQPDIQLELNHIRQLYLNTNYEEAIEKITEVAVKHHPYLDDNLCDLIANRSNQLIEVDIYKNYPRRFFENRLSQLYSGLAIMPESVSRVSQDFPGVSIRTTGEAERAILSLPVHADETIMSQYYNLVSESSLYQRHDRQDKPGFSDKNMESKGIVIGKEVYSKNKGVLTSNAPNFYDELAEKEMRNRVVDTTSTVEDDELYSFSRPRSAFVASLSGHTFLLVLFIEKYMQAHAQDENLQTDINNFIKSIISVYVSHGYHSFFEVTDVFKEPNVQQIFANFNVVLDLSWQSDIVDKASKDTQEYTKALCLRKIVASSYLTSSFFIKPNKEHDDVDEKEQPAIIHMV